MRRLLAMVTAFVVTMSLTAVPAEAVPYPVLLSVRLLSPGGTTKIELSAVSETDISVVRAFVRPLDGDSSTPVDDFALVEGTAQDGVWRTESAVTVGQGQWRVDVELTNDDRTLLFNNRATIDNRVETVLSDVEISPTTVDVDNTRGAFKGRLHYRAADGTLTPLADATVRLTRPDGQTDTAVTGADGRAEGTTELTKTGYAKLSYGGDSTYRPVTSATTRITKQRLKTRITLHMPDRLIVGDQVTVSGRLERQSRDGVWGPLAGKELDLQFDKATGGDWHTIAAPVTEADGSYSVPVTITANGAWLIDFANDPVNLRDDYYSYESSYAGTNVRTVAYRTSISGFDAAPEPAGLGGTITVSGTVMRMMPDGTYVPANAAGSVVLQFSANGSTWSDKDVQVPDGDGTFRFEVTAERDGYWRAVVPKTGYSEPSTGPADYVDVRYRTHIHSYNASPEPVKKGAYITVKGLLYRYMPAGKPGPGANIHIYFKPAGSSTWTKMAITKTASNGWFSKKFKASKDGTWLARYWGSNTYIGSNTPSDYVDVR
ncbi:hypothetical protein E1200_25495 [Actinomadura sp. GC306]|uniref:hypothetical protein n=1 Tax=Actinomadura sp. GC306 TaxID=2530367 RepID=UPI001051AE12|nr:hypothetical protein [Actinomadura sp. GC306]TDC62512.1 hypothetical protein E1200_25495 [Actinomadura sp. GC306]